MQKEEEKHFKKKMDTKKRHALKAQAVSREDKVAVCYNTYITIRAL